MPLADHDDTAPSGRQDPTLSHSRIALALRALAALPPDGATPQVLVSQVVAATGASGGIVAHLDGRRVDVLASLGYTPQDLTSCDPLRVGDLSWPLTYAATTGEPVWLSSQAETLARFPEVVRSIPRRERAHAVLPLRAGGGEPLGVLGITFDERHAFPPGDQDILLALADLCALHLRQWRNQQQAGPTATVVTRLGRLVQALSGAGSVDDVARAVAEAGALATGAVFSNIAVLPQESPSATAHLYHLSSLVDEIAQKYVTIPVDLTTPLGTALSTGEDVWLPSLVEIGRRYPPLLGDTVAAGLQASASLVLFGADRRVIGALGLGWNTAQTFTPDRAEELRVVAQLASDALARTRRWERERAARRRIEHLQQTMTALVSSASLIEVVSAVFGDGVAPYGAVAARLILVDERRPDAFVTVGAVGLPESLQPVWNPPAGASPSPLSDVVAAEQTFYLPTLDALDAEHGDVRDALADAGIGSWISIPLRSAAKTLGVLGLGFAAPDALSDATDRLVLTALTSAIADAVSRALRHDSDHDLVVLVQRSLLSDTLPDRPSLRLGARYLPAETRYGIGGDWYDAVTLTRGRTLLMVGDVAGHGVNAAVAMGQIRSAARALAPTYGPAVLLQALDTFVSGTPDRTMVTAAAVTIDPEQMVLTYSLAGHLPPLLRGPDGAVTSLGQADTVPLGVNRSTRPQQIVPVEPGSVLVLYTDGLVERRDEPIDASVDRLVAALAAGPADDPGRLCDLLVERCMPANPRGDDTAIVCAFIDP